MSSANTQIRLPAIIGSNMVLQQEEEVPLWGWDTPGQDVMISSSWSNITSSVKCDDEGAWTIKIKTPKAGGPHFLNISGSETVKLENVLIGEVWLCSGQSNMEMPLKGWSGEPITGSERAIAESDYPEIRLFTVARKTSYEALEDCDGSWAECSPESSPGFSATAYFFGLELYKKLGIPVGLIHSSWGGTPAEAWTNKEYIQQIPYFQTTPGANNSEVFRQKKLDSYEIVQDKWLSDVGFLNDSENPPEWVFPDYTGAGFEKIEVPAKWENTWIGDYNGLVDYRLSFKVPAKWAGKALKIELGSIDEIDMVWVNGKFIGTHPNPLYWFVKRNYEIPEGVIRKGKNTLAIKVGNTNGAGGLVAEESELKIYPVGDGDSYKSLKGKWMARKGESYGDVPDMPYCHNCGEPHAPSALYNGMINPLIPFRIKGAIWYQGESNRYDGKLYGIIFPNMINNWRDTWNQGDFPFYYVQIAPYTYRDDFSTGLLREAQHNTLILSNTGMAVTMDIGDLNGIHPPDKENVGKRLAYWALAKDYDQNIPFSGPLYRESKIEGNKIRIIFDHADNGLKTDGAELIHFQIAGRNGKFIAANAVIDGNTVIVSSPEINNPVAVRFGWGSTDQTNLFNSEGLPAGPFRTDKWDDN